MFRICLLVTYAALLVPLVCACDQGPVVRRDTEFPVDVRSTVKSKSAKVGDAVEFRTVEAVLIGHNIVVPEDATILGTITEVRNQSSANRGSLVRIRIHTLRWEGGEACLNAMVTSIGRGRLNQPNWFRRRLPTFLEGIRIVSHLQENAYTDFMSNRKDITIRSGVTLTLRQIDPGAYRESDFTIQKSDEQRTAENLEH